MIYFQAPIVILSVFNEKLPWIEIFQYINGFCFLYYKLSLQRGGDKLSVFILAGGESSRMKDGDKPHMNFYQDKTLLEFILERFLSQHEVYIVAKNKNNFTSYKAEVLEDELDAGPLGGMYTGLKYSCQEKNFFMACDMPFFPCMLADWMLEKAEQDILIPREEGGWLEPLAAVYNKSCLSAIEETIEKGEKKIIKFFSRVNVEHISKKKLKKYADFSHVFYNVNTREDWAQAKNRILSEYLEKFEKGV